MNCVNYIVRCFGITKDPRTKNFMMIMKYAEYGSLRQYLDNNFNSLDWTKKLHKLYTIAIGLRNIHHDYNLIHHDFHCGNILSYSSDDAVITDLGFCQPANVKRHQTGNKKI